MRLPRESSLYNYVPNSPMHNEITKPGGMGSRFGVTDLLPIINKRSRQCTLSKNFLLAPSPQTAMLSPRLATVPTI